MLKNHLLNYSNVVLQPNYSECLTRDSLDSSVEFLGHTFKSVAIPANMACCISFELAEQLTNNNQFYILHRFYPYDKILQWIAINLNKPYISLSVGVNDKDKEFIKQLAKICHRNNPETLFITIDIAHGHCLKMKNMIQHIQQCFKLHNKKPKIIAGNICTQDAATDLSNWGANAVKIGLSMGKACTTYNSTGIGSPMFSAVLDVSKTSPVPIIADGQIREVGDICKAMVAGANMVMIGSLFASCIDSPSQNSWKYLLKKYLYPNKPDYKIFYGSASSTNKKTNKYVEGNNGMKLSCNKLTYQQFFDKIDDGIKSCMSYGNCKSVLELIKIHWKTWNL